ncbi:MAG: Fic family protein [Chloroflexota bacterium]|nr:Fic family protein [Chloroflexota bacterium]
MPAWNVHFDVRLNTQHPEIINYLAKANALASVIRQIPLPPGLRIKIDALNIMRAVRGTTGIEGAELSEQEVEQIMHTEPDKAVLPPARKRDEQEARNAQALMNYVVEVLQKNTETPLTESFVLDVHKILTQSIEYRHNVPGEYRNHAVSAGSYVPPRSGEEVRSLMKEFIRWFNQGEAKGWDPVIRAIVAHFYIVSIHPFGDGNGRASRGVESFLLYQAGINARGFYSLSNYYYRNRDEYIQQLDHSRFEMDGDITPFVHFALKGLVEELEAVHSEVLHEMKIISFRDFARETLTISGKLHTRSGARIFRLLSEMSCDPISVKDIKSNKHPLAHIYKGMSYKTLDRDIAYLKSLKLLKVDGDKMIANVDIMDTFTPPNEFREQLVIRDTKGKVKKSAKNK